MTALLAIVGNTDGSTVEHGSEGGVLSYQVVIS